MNKDLVGWCLARHASSSSLCEFEYGKLSDYPRSILYLYIWLLFEQGPKKFIIDTIIIASIIIIVTVIIIMGDVLECARHLGVYWDLFSIQLISEVWDGRNCIFRAFLPKLLLLLPRLHLAIGPFLRNWGILAFREADYTHTLYNCICWQ